jgi:ubiquinone/menaquinone biosynthesis C-methylase UbiE
MMKNPWLDIPLADYESHMALPHVAQSGLLAELFGLVLKMYSPESVAVLGCAGGNGFDRVDPSVTGRVVGIDLNPEYIAATADRFKERLPALQLLVGDMESEAVTFEPVAMIYAALVFEYVNAAAVLKRLPSLLRHDGLLCTIVQLPSASIPSITPSAFASIGGLSTVMRLVSPQELRELAAEQELQEVHQQQSELPSGKRFQMQVFRRESGLHSNRVDAR